LPISVGGTGVRELVFLFASGYIGTSNYEAVSLSLIFYIISTVSSFFGVFVLHKVDSAEA
jgi:hypothetical protein